MSNNQQLLYLAVLTFHILLHFTCTSLGIVISCSKLVICPLYGICLGCDTGWDLKPRSKLCRQCDHFSISSVLIQYTSEYDARLERKEDFHRCIQLSIYQNLGACAEEVLWLSLFVIRPLLPLTKSNTLKNIKFIIFSHHYGPTINF